MAMRTQDQGVMGSLLTVCPTTDIVVLNFIYHLANSS